jgi:hypothetical protein
MYFAAISDPNNDNGGAESERKKKEETDAVSQSGWLAAAATHRGEKASSRREKWFELRDCVGTCPSLSGPVNAGSGVLYNKRD